MGATALVIGGTGPTGPHMVQGLLERGYDVELFHTGRHETDALPEVPHTHGDPFTREGVTQALAGRSFDVVLATYGRTRLIGEALAGRCRHLVAVGGTPVYAGFADPESQRPAGMVMPTDEAHPRVGPDAPSPPAGGYPVGAIRRTEDRLFELGEDGAFSTTILRYPTIYGPRNPHPWEWSVIRRILDRRPWIVVIDGGRSVYSRCAAANAAHGMLLAVDQPEVSEGKAYNVADDRLLSQRQWIELIAMLMNADIAVRSLPATVMGPGHALMPYSHLLTAHCIIDSTLIRTDLGYSPVVTTEIAMGELIEDFVGRESEMRHHPDLTDPFDYAAEDRLMDAYELAISELAPLWAPFGQSIRAMPTVQSAKAVTPPEP